MPSTVFRLTRVSSLNAHQPVQEYYYHPHFTDEETETQITRPKCKVGVRILVVRLQSLSP